MRKSQEKEVLQNIRNEQKSNMLDFTDNVKIQVTVKKINPNISFVLKYLDLRVRFNEEMSRLNYDIRTIRDDEDKKEYLKKMRNLLNDSDFNQQKEKPFKKQQIELQHSVTWYIYNRIDKEIAAIDKKNEIENDFLKVRSNFMEIMSIIRDSNSPEEAHKKMMEELSLTNNGAKEIIKIKLSSMKKYLDGSLDEVHLREIDYLAKIKSLLERLK